jgi:outer membrane protein
VKQITKFPYVCRLFQRAYSIFTGTGTLFELAKIKSMNAMKTLTHIRKVVITTLFLGTLTLTTFAQKFAYVDTEYILSQLPSYRSAQKQIDEISEKWQKEIDLKYDEIDKMYKDYQAEKVILSGEMQKKREDEIIEKERLVKKLQQEKFGYEGELFKKRQELIKPIQDQVFAAIQKTSKDNALDFIFDKSGDMVMLFTNAKYDKSNEVLEELGVVPTATKPIDKNKLPPGNGEKKPMEMPPR